MPEVLVVDDDPDIRTLVAFTLADVGHQVRQAADGPSALAAIEERAPDVLVLDVMMPGQDGFSVLGALRARGMASATRVMVLTCKGEEREHVRGFELGADEYVTKPFDPDDLTTRVRALLTTSPDALAHRRVTELRKAAFLDRLEQAFAASLPAGPRH